MIKFLLRKLINKYSFVRGSINLNNRQGALHKTWGYIFENHLFGDYVEFGVAKGDSLLKSILEYNFFKTWLDSEKISNNRVEKRSIK